MALYSNRYQVIAKTPVTGKTGIIYAQFVNGNDAQVYRDTLAARFPSWTVSVKDSQAGKYAKPS